SVQGPKTPMKALESSRRMWRPWEAAGRVQEAVPGVELSHYLATAFDGPIFIRFLLHRRQRRIIFPLPPTLEPREGMPKGQQGGHGTLPPACFPQSQSSRAWACTFRTLHFCSPTLVSRARNSFAKSLNLAKNQVCICGPYEGPGMLVSAVQIVEH